MQAAPITSAASAVPGTGADPNGAGGDLFAALMAALFNPAQMAQAALTPTGDPAMGGGDPLADLSGGGRLVPPVPEGGTDLVDRPPIPQVDADAGRPSPEVSGGEAGEGLPIAFSPDRRAMLAPTGAEAKLAMGRLATPADAPAAAPRPDRAPADDVARPEVVALKGQMANAPAGGIVPVASTLIAAQTQAPPAMAHGAQPQPLLAQPKSKPATTVETALDRLGAPRPTKGGLSALTTAQLSAQAPAAAIVIDADDQVDAADVDDGQTGLDPAALGGREGALRADAHHAAAPLIVRGSPHTVAHLSAEIARRLEAQSTKFQIELEPAGLGKVEVRVEIGAEGALTAALNCDSAQTADVLRARSGELQAALEQAGFDVSGGLNFTADGAGHGRREQAGRDGQPAEPALTLAALDEAPPVTPQPPRAGPGRLDIRI